MIKEDKNRKKEKIFTESVVMAKRQQYHTACNCRYIHMCIYYIYIYKYVNQIIVGQ